MRRSPVAFYARVRRLLRGLALTAGGLAAGCSGAHEPTQQSEHPASRPLVPPVVNVPAMLGKPIESLRRSLGNAVPLPAAYQDSNTYAPLDPVAADSIVTFRKGRLLLIACYNIRSRQVHDLLLLGRHEDSLMHQAALRSNMPNYLVMPVFRANRAGSLLGLRVIDTRPNRN